MKNKNAGIYGYEVIGFSVTNYTEELVFEKKWHGWILKPTKDCSWNLPEGEYLCTAALFNFEGAETIFAVKPDSSLNLPWLIRYDLQPEELSLLDKNFEKVRYVGFGLGHKWPEEQKE
jgi:hypothetical protein